MQVHSLDVFNIFSTSKDNLAGISFGATAYRLQTLVIL